MLDEVRGNRGPSRRICHTATVHYAQHVAVLGVAAVTKNFFRCRIKTKHGWTDVDPSKRMLFRKCALLALALLYAMLTTHAAALCRVVML